MPAIIVGVRRRKTLNNGKFVEQKVHLKLSKNSGASAFGYLLG